MEETMSTLTSRARESDDGLARLRSDLVRAVRKACPPGLGVQQEDIVQIAMMKVMELQAKDESRQQLSPSYLYKVAYSVAIDELRKLRRRPEVSFEGEEVAEPAFRESPEQRASSREIGQAIVECLRRLRRPRRLAVTLHLQGHSILEAARLLAWGLKRTENLVYRGLDDLRRCLDSKAVRP